MDRIIWNYSSLKSREQRIYSFGDTPLNGGAGISVNTLLIVVPFTLATTILGAIVGGFLNKSYIPWASNFSLFHTIFWIGSGIAIALLLYKVRFSGYRLYEYLLGYLRKKRVYTNDMRMSRVQHTNLKIDTFVKHIF